MASQLDERLIASRVKVAAKERGVQISKGFAPIVLQALFRLTETEVNDSITDGGNDQGIDAVHIEDGQQPIVHLINCRYRESEKRSTTRNFPSAEIAKILAFLDFVISGSADATAGNFNPELTDKVHLISKLLDDGAPVTFRIHLVSNGLPLQPNDRESFLERLRPYRHVKLSEVGVAELASLISQRTPQTSEVKLKLSTPVHTQKSYVGSLSINAIICSVSADEIVDFIQDKANPDKVNWDVFDQNLRGFLGLANDVNDRVFRTAVGEDCHKFWYLNNGIAIVCQDFRVQPKRERPMITMIDPQIVNGCQTSNVLFEVWRDRPERLSDIEVMVRIYSTNDSQMRREIAQATNTQTRISSRDLRANDPIQQKIEMTLAAEGFEYLRKQAGSQHSMSSRVEPLRFGQVVVAAIQEDPDRAITRSDEILSERYDEIFNSKLDILNVVPLLHCLEFIEKSRIDRQTNAALRRLSRERSLAYASFHLLFIMKKLADLDGKILLQENFETLFTRAISILSEIMKESRQTSNYQLFRSPKTKQLILAKLQLGKAQLSLI
ncbi:MAG: AIPR family protein [Afipia birgiae]|nr:AIPR family protein [Afipia birgiae]